MPIPGANYLGTSIAVYSRIWILPAPFLVTATPQELLKSIIKAVLKCKAKHHKIMFPILIIPLLRNPELQSVGISFEVSFNFPISLLGVFT